MANSRSVPLSRLRRSTAGALLAVLVPGTGVAQTAVREPALKAAFIYNFARFTEWPPESVQSGAFTMCVLGDEDLAGALEGTVREKTIAGRAVVVLRVTPGGLATCNVLYLGDLTPGQSRAVLDGLTGIPVLTVSNRPHFAQTGGIIGLFLDAGRMRFAVNVDAAQRCRVRLSSRLLSLATLVRDGHEQ